MKRTSSSSATPRTNSRTAAAGRVVKSPAKKRTTATAGVETTRADETMSLSESAIATRAYEIFLARNGEPGDPVSDWLQAERELRAVN
jgi:hypothetical protein